MIRDIDGNYVVRVGDKTTHGGIVISGAEQIFVEGQSVARVGDMVRCPRCQGDFPIVEGSQTFISDGRPVAYHGDRVACGAQLISSYGGVQRLFNDDDSELAGLAGVSSPYGLRAQVEGRDDYARRRELYRQDVALIMSSYRSSIQAMNERGLRRPGAGFDNAVFNNVQASDTPPGSWMGGQYYRCYDQSIFVLQQLYKLDLNLPWIFNLANEPGHYWAEALPGDDAFDVIVMDALYDSVRFTTTPTKSTTIYPQTPINETPVRK